MADKKRERPAEEDAEDAETREEPTKTEQREALKTANALAAPRPSVIGVGHDPALHLVVGADESTAESGTGGTGDG